MDVYSNIATDGYRIFYLDILMDPEIWGKHGWNFLNSVVLSYPISPTNQDKINYLNFFNSLQYVLPCYKCQVNFSKKLIKYPLSNFLDTRESLLKWIIDVHNDINVSNNKKFYSYPDAVVAIEEDLKPPSNLILYTSIIANIILTSLILCKRNNIIKL